MYPPVLHTESVKFIDWFPCRSVVGLPDLVMASIGAAGVCVTVGVTVGDGQKFFTSTCDTTVSAGEGVYAIAAVLGQVAHGFIGLSAMS